MSAIVVWSYVVLIGLILLGVIIWNWKTPPR
jgi:hypothetical protein